MFHKNSTRHPVLSGHYIELLTSSHSVVDRAVHYEKAGKTQSYKSYSGSVK